MTSGLLAAVTLVGVGLVAASAGSVSPNLGSLAAGGGVVLGTLHDQDLIKGLSLSALGGALFATGAAILGAIPLAMGLGMLAVEGLKRLG